MNILTFLLQLFWAFWEYQPADGSWFRKFLDFLIACHLPGSKDAGKKDIHIIRRLLWLAYIFCGLAFSTIAVISTTQNFLHNPVNYSYNSINVQLSEIASPAVIVSKPNSFNKDKLVEAQLLYVNALLHGKAKQNGEIWTLKETETLMYSVYDICRTDATLTSWYTNSTKPEFDGTLFKEIFEANNKTFMDDITKNGVNNKIRNFLNEGLGSCSDMVKACYLNGKVTDCKSLLVATHTEMGRSCAFNFYPRSLLRRNETTQTALDFQNITDMQKYSWGKYTLDENSFHKGTTAEHSGSISMPIFQTLPGHQNGLTLVLVMDDNEEIICRQNDGVAHVVSIRSPAEDADASDNGIFIPPMMEIYINLQATITSADRAIKSVAQSLRGCIFSDETEDLEFYNFYTEENCRKECAAKAVFDACHCNRITDPKKPGTVLCKPADDRCLKNVTEAVFKNQTACQKCLPTCTKITYKPTVSSLPYSSSDPNDENRPGIIKELGITKRSSIVHIFFGSSSVPLMYKSRRMTAYELISEYGGSYGLTNGVSFIDLFRIFWAVWGLYFPARALANAISSSSNPPPPPLGGPPSPPSQGPSSPPESSRPSLPSSPRPSSSTSTRGPQSPPPGPALPRVPPATSSSGASSASRRRSLPVSPRNPESLPRRGSLATSPRVPTPFSPRGPSPRVCFPTSPRLPSSTSPRVLPPTSPNGPSSASRRRSFPISPRGPQSLPHRSSLPTSPTIPFPISRLPSVTSPRVLPPASPRAPSAISPRAPSLVSPRGISLPPRHIPPASLRIPAPISPQRLLPPVAPRSLPPPHRAPGPNCPSRKSPEGQCPQAPQPVPAQGPYFLPNPNDTNTLQLPSEIRNPLVPSSRGQRIIPVINVIPPPPPLPIEPPQQTNQKPLSKKVSNRRKRVLSNAVLRVLIILDKRRPEHYAPESTDIIMVQPANASDNLPDNDETSL